MLTTYYSSLMGLIGSYLWDSFKNPLPWSFCYDTWHNCTNSTPFYNDKLSYNYGSNSTGINYNLITSSELYYV